MTTIWSGDDTRDCQEISEEEKSDSGCQIFKCNVTVKNNVILIQKQTNKKNEVEKSMKKTENPHPEFCTVFFQVKL